MRAKRLLSCLSLLMLVAVLLLAVAGCRDSGEEPLLEDRFGNAGSGWGEESQDGFDRGYHQGEYFIEVYEPDWFVWANPGRRFTDVVAEVDARWVSGSPAGHFGLLCRHRAPGDFYYFAITGDGYYAILRVQDGEAEVLTGDGFLPSAAIRTGEAANHIRAVCHGEELALYVDGEELARATDDVLRRGDVGLGAGSGSEPSIRVHFDNLVVTAPEEEE